MNVLDDELFIASTILTGVPMTIGEVTLSNPFLFVDIHKCNKFDKFSFVSKELDNPLVP